MIVMVDTVVLVVIVTIVVMIVMGVLITTNVYRPYIMCQAFCEMD